MSATTLLRRDPETPPELRRAVWWALGAEAVLLGLVAGGLPFGSTPLDEPPTIEFTPGGLVALGNSAQGEVGSGSPIPGAPADGDALTDEADVTTPPEPRNTTAPEPATGNEPREREPKPRPKLPGRGGNRGGGGLPVPDPTGDGPGSRGNPFGDPNGWSDLAGDGDPWADAVLRALSNMPVGSYAARLDDADGEVRFVISVCKDGRIDDVKLMGGDLSADGKQRVALALEQLRLPAPPPAMQRHMQARCVRLRHTFVWRASGVG